MTRKEFDIKYKQCCISFERVEICEDYIKSLEAKIAELEAPKNCDGCKHIYIMCRRGYETATCTNNNCTEMYDCDVGDNFYCSYYEPKDIK